MNTLQTPRDKVETTLLAAMPGKLHSLDESWISTINRFKDGNFGFSYLGLLLYTNGHNVHSTSTKNPRGLIFCNEDAIFGVGVFFRPHEPEIPCIHIVAPRGNNWRKGVEDFTAQVGKTMPQAVTYVRHLTPSHYKALQCGDPSGSSSWDSIESRPWIEGAGKEDETHSSRIIHFKNVLRPGSEDVFANIPYLTGDSKVRARRSVRRFRSFLEDNDLEYVLHPYTMEREADARWVVRTHFSMLEEAKRAIGSTAADYENIIKAFPEKLPESTLHMYVGYLKHKNGSRSLPVSFFAYENISKSGAARMAGGYATITIRDEEAVKQMAPGLIRDSREFDAISTYAFGKMYRMLESDGIYLLDEGGSETQDLDRGKRHRGATPRLTHWAVHVRTVGGQAMMLC